MQVSRAARLLCVWAMVSCQPPERNFRDATAGAGGEDGEGGAGTSATSCFPGAGCIGVEGGGGGTAITGPQGSSGASAEPTAPEPRVVDPPAAEEPEPVMQVGPDGSSGAPEPEMGTGDPEPTVTESGVAPEPPTLPVTAAPEPSPPPEPATLPEPATPPEPAPSPAPTLPADEGEPIGGCGEQLLHNGAFDFGDVAWTSSSTFPGIEVIVGSDSTALTQQGVAPRSEDYLAWLGGIPDNPYEKHIVRLGQRVTIPEGTTGLSFSGAVWIRTEETDPGVAYDAAFVDVTNLEGDVLWHPHAFTNLEANENWAPFEYTTDEVAFAGTEVFFDAHSETDLDFVTSFWFADLRLVASCLR